MTLISDTRNARRRTGDVALSRNVRRPRSVGNTALKLAVLLIYLVTLAPLAIVVAVAFNPERIVFPPEAMSIRSFQALAGNAAFLASLRVSFFVALISSTVACALAILVALAMRRLPPRPFAAVNGLFLSPLLVPSMLLGLAMYQVFFAIFGARHVAALVLAHAVAHLPFPIRTTWAAMAAASPSMEEAAQSLGASRWTVIRRITLPIIAPGVFAGMLFSFAMSWNDFPIAMFLAGRGYMTFPVQLYFFLEYEYKPIVAAMAAVTILGSIVFVLILDRIVGIRKLYG
jgi:putative spermidine/putrescine transport system permease protein